MLPPGSGSGAYFGRSFAMPPILFPISSNGFTAASTALLTHFAAINDAQTNTSAIMSIIITPREFPALSSAQNICPHVLELVAGHSKFQVIQPISTLVVVFVFPSVSGVH